MFKKTILATATALILAGCSTQAPQAPTLSKDSYQYALVEINPSAVAYKEMVTLHDSVTVNVEWQLPENVKPDTEAKLLLDGNEKWRGVAGDLQASFTMEQGGKWQMSLQLCNRGGCVDSAGVPLIIADTDGSHLDPLPASYPELHKPVERTSDQVVGSYYVEWAVYGRNYPFQKVPVNNLTHILYGFIPICSASHNESLAPNAGGWELLQKVCAGSDEFEVVIHDAWAALQMNHNQPGANADSDPYKGIYAAMMAAKKTNPDLKILPSIGGWTLSDPFHQFHDVDNRKTFVNSVEKFLRTWKFYDGVDIDWEHPGGNAANPKLGDKERDGELYVTLMKELRSMLDGLEKEMGKEYQLTSAMNAGHDKIAVVDYGEAGKYLDYLFAMTYDFYTAGQNTELNHHAGLYESSLRDMGQDNYFAANGVDLLIASGMPKEKIVLGVAAYGRGWKGVDQLKEAENPFSGVGGGPIDGTWEAGVLDYRAIHNSHTEKEGFVRGYDQQAQAPYLWKAATGELITYDDEQSIKAKGDYVLEKGLGGLFSWEIDGDNGVLTNAMNRSLGNKMQ